MSQTIKIERLVTVIERIYVDIPEDTDLKSSEFIEFAEEIAASGISELNGERHEGYSQEFIPETETLVEVGSDNASTVELYVDDELLWDNSKGFA